MHQSTLYICSETCLSNSSVNFKRDYVFSELETFVYVWYLYTFVNIKNTFQENVVISENVKMYRSGTALPVDLMNIMVFTE